MFKKAVSAGLISVFFTTQVFSSPGKAALSFVAPRPSTLSFVLVEDVHSNLEAQKQIGRTLLDLQAKALQNNEKLLIAAEAAHGRFDFSRFRQFPDKAALTQMADYLLKEDLISAVSWFGLSAPTLPAIVGVDDTDLYLKNVASYQKNYLQKERWERQIEEEMVAFVPNEPQRPVYRIIKDYFSARKTIFETTQELIPFSQKPLALSLKLAGISTEQIQKERDAFLAKQGRISIDQFPALKAYIEIKPEQFIEDFEALLKEMAVSHGLERIYELSLQKKLVRFEMTPADWHAYKTNRQDPNLQTFKDFYLLAEARNHAMVENALKAARKEGAQKVVLIAGGFHTAGLKALLVQKGISVSIISPKLTSVVEKDVPALNSFLTDHGPLQKLFFGGQSTVADGAHMLGPRPMPGARMLPKALPVLAFMMAAFAAQDGVVKAAEQSVFTSVTNGSFELVGVVGNHAIVHQWATAQNFVVGPAAEWLNGNAVVAPMGAFVPVFANLDMRVVAAGVFLGMVLILVGVSIVRQIWSSYNDVPDEIKFHDEQNNPKEKYVWPNENNEKLFFGSLYAFIALVGSPFQALMFRMTIWWFTVIGRPDAINSFHGFEGKTERYFGGGEFPLGFYRARITRNIFGRWSLWVGQNGSTSSSHLTEVEPFLQEAESVMIVQQKGIVGIYSLDKKKEVIGKPVLLDEYADIISPKKRPEPKKNPWLKWFVGGVILVPTLYFVPQASVFLTVVVAGVLIETTQRFAQRYQSGDYDHIEPDVLKHVEAGQSLNPSLETDAYQIDVSNYAENLRLHTLAIENLIKFSERMTFTDLMGGIAGRMKKVAPGAATIKLLTEYVDWLKDNGVDVFDWMRARGKNIRNGDYEALALNYPTKGVIPVGKNAEGKFVTKLGEFLIGIRRLQEFLESERAKRGLPAVKPIKLNVVLIATEEARDALIDWDLKIHNYYGLNPDQIKIRVQEINYGFVARAQDVEKYKANFVVGSDDSKYQEALAYAQGHQGEVVMSKTPWGHAEVPIQTISSGHIIELLERKAYANFVRNVDNSGARPDWMWLVGYGRALEARRQGARIGLALEVSERPKDESGRGGGIFRLGDNGHSRQIVLEDSILRMIRESIRGKTLPTLRQQGFQLVQDMSEIALLIPEDETITTTLGTKLTGQQVRQWAREYDNVPALDKRIEIYYSKKENQVLVFEQLVDRSSYYVNNAVGTIFWDVILEDVFETTEKEILSLRTLPEEDRDKKLREISDRGWSKVNLIFEPKPHALDDGTTIPIIRPEGNMWDLLKIVHVMALGVDSTESTGRKISANPFLSRMLVELMRFAPVKSWTDSDAYLKDMSGEYEEDEWSINEAMLSYTFSGDMFAVPTMESFMARSEAGSLHPLHKQRRTANWEWAQKRVALKQGVTDEDLDANKAIIDENLQPIPQRSLTLDVSLNERLKPIIDRDVIEPLKNALAAAGLGEKIAWKETLELSLANLLLNQGDRKLTAQEIRHAINAVNTVANDVRVAPFVAEGVYLSESFTIRIAMGPRADDPNHSVYSELRDRLNNVLEDNGGQAPKDFYATIGRLRKPLSPDEFGRFVEILSRYQETRFGQFSIREAVINENVDWTHTSPFSIRRYGVNGIAGAFLLYPLSPLAAFAMAGAIVAGYFAWQYWKKNNSKGVVLFAELQADTMLDILAATPINGGGASRAQHHLIRGAINKILVEGRITPKSLYSLAYLVGRNNAIGLPVENPQYANTLLRSQAQVLAFLAKKGNLSASLTPAYYEGIIKKSARKAVWTQDKKVKAPEGEQVFAHYNFDDFKIAAVEGGLEAGLRDLAGSVRAALHKRLGGVVITVSKEDRYVYRKWLMNEFKMLGDDGLSPWQLAIVDRYEGETADPMAVQKGLLQKGHAVNWILARPLEAGLRRNTWHFSDTAQLIVDMIKSTGEYVRIDLKMGETMKAMQEALKAA